MKSNINPDYETPFMPANMKKSVRRIFLVLLMTTIGCYGKSLPQTPASSVSQASASWLTDITQPTGLAFSRDGGSIQAFEMPQIMGSGGGMFDYDGDGDLDIFLIGGGDYPLSSTSPQVTSRLFRQEADGHFVDVTEESGLKNTGYGMGIAVGDADNDGDLDVFLSNAGDDRFFVNKGNGVFIDHTPAAGVSDPNWSTACSFVDFDRDGWLDLVVVNYVDYFPGSPCYDRSGRRDFCGPQSFKGTVDRLYRNKGVTSEAGGPLFEDHTVVSGLAGAVGKGLGVMCADFNDDERPDILVANDMEPNRLWIQQKNGTFRDEAVVRGLSVNQQGQAEANMGVVFDDLNRDGRFDVLITHLRGESNTLWQGEQGGLYYDITPQTGLGPASISMTGFGVTSIDLNLDGRLDLLIVNGHVKRPGGLQRDSSATRDFWSDYAQPNQLFLQTAPGVFRNELQLAGTFTETNSVARGLIRGDIDNDGDLDLLVTTANGPARLYRNDAPRDGAWLLIRVIDAKRCRDAYGARVTVECGDQKWTQFVQPSSGYLSHHDPRLHFGLGGATEVKRITVHWPLRGGDIAEEFTDVKLNQSVELRRGTSTQ